MFDGMADVTGYVGMQEFLNKISFGRIAVIRKFDGDEKKKGAREKACAMLPRRR